MTLRACLAPALVTFAVGACAATPTAVLPPCDTSAAMPALDANEVVHAIAVGDVAECPGGKQGDVSDLALSLAPDLLMALGDLAYPNGSLDDYLSCYGPSFGRLRSVTRAVPGNHEYHTPHAGAYYTYFCGSSGAPFKGYYSFDVGAWHIVALNSVCGQDPEVPSEVTDEFGGCRDESEQLQWLRGDLLAHPNGCRAAMWHHPRYSQSSEGASPMMTPAWRLIADAQFDLVVNGHAHNYQRYPPLDAKGKRDDAHGVREFVIGTGGSAFSEFDDSPNQASEVRNGNSHGLLELDLARAGYTWRFRSIVGEPFVDSGDAKCHRGA